MGENEIFANLVARQDELTALMSVGDLAPDAYRNMAKEFAELAPVVEKIKELETVTRELDDLAELLSDPEMKEMAEAESRELRARVPRLEQALQIMLLPKDAADDKNAILEVRAGTGGDEASLFAAELFRMYQRYAEARRWKFEVLSISDNELGGYKEASAMISGRGVFARMKFESGVHRVQRVPATESSGRIHTSAATVAVLPEAEEVDVQIGDKDLRIDIFRASGPGGQKRNKTSSAVRLRHRPSSFVAPASPGSCFARQLRRLDFASR